MKVKRVYRAVEVAQSAAPCAPDHAVNQLHATLIQVQHTRIRAHAELIQISNGQAEELEAMIEAAQRITRERDQFSRFARWFLGTVRGG